MLAAIKRWKYIDAHPKKTDVRMCVIQLAVKHTLAIENNLFAKHKNMMVNLTCLQLNRNNWGEPERAPHLVGRMVQESRSQKSTWKYGLMV